MVTHSHSELSRCRHVIEPSPKVLKVANQIWIDPKIQLRKHLPEQFQKYRLASKKLRTLQLSDLGQDTRHATRSIRAPKERAHQGQLALGPGRAQREACEVDETSSRGRAPEFLLLDSRSNFSLGTCFCFVY
jgi:hypothetical protein